MREEEEETETEKTNLRFLPLQVRRATSLTKHEHNKLLSRLMSVGSPQVNCVCAQFCSALAFEWKVCRRNIFETLRIIACNFSSRCSAIKKISRVKRIETRTKAESNLLPISIFFLFEVENKINSDLWIRRVSQTKKTTSHQNRRCSFSDMRDARRISRRFSSTLNEGEPLNIYHMLINSNCDYAALFTWISMNAHKLEAADKNVPCVGWKQISVEKM